MGGGAVIKTVGLYVLELLPPIRPMTRRCSLGIFNDMYNLRSAASISLLVVRDPLVQNLVLTSGRLCWSRLSS